MKLEGNNVYLRGLESTDLPDRHRWLNDPEITQFFTNLGTIPIAIENLDQWYLNIKNDTREIHFSICLKNDVNIGGAQLKSIDWRNRNAEFGLFIGEKEEWSKGYGSQVTALLTDYAFGTLNLHRLWLRVDSQNKAAIKCYQKSGFIQEGIFREEVYRNGKYSNSVVMSILRSNWEKQKLQNNQLKLFWVE